MKVKLDKYKVTIAILAHGGKENLPRAIDSVVSQTYTNIEIIIVHDSTAEILEDVKPKYPNIKLVHMPFESIAKSLKIAIDSASGKYFSWLSQDDEYTPDKIQTEIGNILDLGDNTIAVSDWVFVNPNGRPIHTYKVDNKIRQGAKEYLAFSQDTGINTSAMLCPTSLITSVHLDDTYPTSRDISILNELVNMGAKIINTGVVGLKYSTSSEELYRPSNAMGIGADQLSSHIIKELDYRSILNYFGDAKEAINCYRRLLDSSKPRSAAYLISSFVTGAVLQKEFDLAKDIIVNDLSGLSETGIEMKVDEIVPRILKTSGKKKILFSSAHWLTGGMERVLSILFRELENDYDIYLITPYHQRQSHIDVAAHVKWVQISEDNFQKHFDAIILAYALILKIDVVVGFINLFNKQLNLYELCTGTGIKTIASNHEYYFYPYKSAAHYNIVKKRLESFMYCDAVIWPNSINAALCGMYIKNSYVIGNPNNFDVYLPNVKKKENTIICIGRFNDYVKRIDRILDCYELIRRKVPNAKLLLVGRYDLNAPIYHLSRKTLAEKLKELNLSPEDIEFVGEVNNVQDYLLKSKVLMLTSESEGFGMVLNEAACYGVPSVCNYIPGLEDIIEDGKNGYVTPQGDLDSMASKIVDILNDDALCKTLSENAKSMASRFDSKHIGDKWRLLINTLTADAHREPHNKLIDAIGYQTNNKQLVKILSNELNDTFFNVLTHTNAYKPEGGVDLIISKAIRLPKRLKQNIEFEGLSKTFSKISSRTYKIVSRQIKKRYSNGEK